ncbi:MAG: cupin [Synechococcales bacterium]|nr:cupin [Synechococcales bacterium]
MSLPEDPPHSPSLISPPVANDSVANDLSHIDLADCQDFLITNSGKIQGLFPDPFTPPLHPYRLYRFLTNLEDILAQEPDDALRLQQIMPMVRSLLTSSDWLQLEYQMPSPQTGWNVKMLYREPNFPLTVQMVSWLPGYRSTVHNHATWGVVALIHGQEKNTFWRRSPTADHPDRIASVSEQVLVPGDIIGFLPDAIHSVEAMGEEPTISFNLYGVTDFNRRFEFDPTHHTAKKF